MGRCSVRLSGRHCTRFALLSILGRTGQSTQVFPARPTGSRTIAKLKPPAPHLSLPTSFTPDSSVQDSSRRQRYRSVPPPHSEHAGNGGAGGGSPGPPSPAHTRQNNATPDRLAACPSGSVGGGCGPGRGVRGERPHALPGFLGSRGRGRDELTLLVRGFAPARSAKMWVMTSALRGDGFPGRP